MNSLNQFSISTYPTLKSQSKCDQEANIIDLKINSLGEETNRTEVLYKYTKEGFAKRSNITDLRKAVVLERNQESGKEISEEGYRIKYFS